MNKVERLEEERSARRWFVAGAVLWLSIPVVSGVLWAAFAALHPEFPQDVSYTLMLAGLLLVTAAGIAGLGCLVTGAILYISSESRPG